MGIGRYTFGSNYTQTQSRPPLKSRYGQALRKAGAVAKRDSYLAARQASGNSSAKMMDLSAVISKNADAQKSGKSEQHANVEKRPVSDGVDLSRWKYSFFA